MRQSSGFRGVSAAVRQGSRATGIEGRHATDRGNEGTLSQVSSTDHSPVLRLEVLRSHRVSPSFQRVVVGGAELRRLPRHGYDHWFRLFFRARGQEELVLPFRSSESWYQQWLACDEALRPEIRNYTVRELRSDEGELDIDFVLHPSQSGQIDTPAARWSLDAEPGEELGLLDQGVTFAEVPGDPVLVVGDETALPAVEGILRGLDRAAQGRAVIEVPTTADIRDLGGPAGVGVGWVARDARGAGHGIPGEALLEHLGEWLRGPDAGGPDAGRHDAAGPGAGAGLDPTTRVFVAGESGLATGLRRLLVASGHAKDRIRFTGYWKSDRTPAVAGR